MTDRKCDLEDINQKLQELSTEANELYLDKEIPVLEVPPSPLEFYRCYVSPNKPVLIRNAVNHWPALTAWTNEYLREKLRTRQVTVAVTPNGYADAVTDDRFVMPEEREMTMSQFLDIMENPGLVRGVYYVQKQNSNHTEEFHSIIQDVDTEIGWGSKAFAKSPDAVNFWMGDKRAITSMHKDHYENLYVVIRGWKKFILIPPTDLQYVPYEKYKAAKFKETENGEFVIEEDPQIGQVPWVAINPLNPDLNRYPQYKKATPMEVTVCEGEMLYLPSLWLHHVQQSHGCIAVNYWYDMEFDIKYNYFKFMEGIVDMVR